MPNCTLFRRVTPLRAYTTKLPFMSKTQVVERERLHNELETMSGLKMEDYEVGGLGFHKYDSV